jgi:hypothetical protein
MIEEIEYKINTDKKENLEINKFDGKKKNLHNDPKKKRIYIMILKSLR